MRGNLNENLRGTEFKDIEWNYRGQNLKINNFDPTLLPTHFPTTLVRFESSWKTVTLMKGTAWHWTLKLNKKLINNKNLGNITYIMCYYPRNG